MKIETVGTFLDELLRLVVPFDLPVNGVIGLDPAMDRVEPQHHEYFVIRTENEASERKDPDSNWPFECQQ